MVNRLNQVLILVFIFICSAYESAYGQSSIKHYDSYNDTLLYFGERLLDTDKVLVDRNDALLVDSLSVNQKGLFISGFTMSAISLGNSIELDSKSGKISEQMKQELINEQKNFKFIYIKNIILQSKDGRVLSPSTKSIKITFIN